MEACSNKVYIKNDQKLICNKTLGFDDWEVNSEELNGSFDSDDFKQVVGSEQKTTCLFTCVQKLFMSLNYVYTSVLNKFKQQNKEQDYMHKYQIDTNIMKVYMSTLETEDCTNGNPVFCTNCSAILNAYTNIEQTERI
ncbi:unnamed protein product [Moneuplotes crassus]|uniref:Uncharacterized protein n=1 Tax=Euplotes crassus TaxID=5936 RepID=A0AAD1U748_EUPCR|nr:unnamed protein product [Moneuplotes crassus]